MSAAKRLQVKAPEGPLEVAIMLVLCSESAAPGYVLGQVIQGVRFVSRGRLTGDAQAIHTVLNRLADKQLVKYKKVDGRHYGKYSSRVGLTTLRESALRTLVARWYSGDMRALLRTCQQMLSSAG